jgi:hypothetical protein
VDLARLALWFANDERAAAEIFGLIQLFGLFDFCQSFVTPVALPDVGCETLDSASKIQV